MTVAIPPAAVSATPTAQPGSTAAEEQGTGSAGGDPSFASALGHALRPGESAEPHPASGRGATRSRRDGSADDPATPQDTAASTMPSALAATLAVAALAPLTPSSPTTAAPGTAAVPATEAITPIAGTTPLPAISAIPTADDSGAPGAPGAAAALAPAAPPAATAPEVSLDLSAGASAAAAATPAGARTNTPGTVAQPGTETPSAATGKTPPRSAVTADGLPVIAAASTSADPTAGSADSVAAPHSAVRPEQTTAPHDEPAPVTDGPGVAAPAAPAAPPQAAAAAPATSATSPPPPISTQVAQPTVALLRSAPDGVHTMTVQISPEHLGPVQVHVTMDKGQIDLTLRGAHEHSRDALIEALPLLRRDLEGAGLSCNRVEVDPDANQSSWSLSQDAGSSQQGYNTPSDRRARSWMASGDHGPTSITVRAADQSTSSGVDVRV